MTMTERLFPPKGVDMAEKIETCEECGDELDENTKGYCSEWCQFVAQQP